MTIYKCPKCGKVISSREVLYINMVHKIIKKCPYCKWPVKKIVKEVT